MKALAAEMVRNFGSRLAPLGIAVRELTGDMQLTKAEIRNTQVGLCVCVCVCNVCVCVCVYCVCVCVCVCVCIVCLCVCVCVCSLITHSLALLSSLC